MNNTSDAALIRNIAAAGPRESGPLIDDLRSRVDSLLGPEAVALRKARRERLDSEMDSEVEDWGVLGQHGYGGLSDSAPRGVPRRRPVPSSGRGAEQLAGESDYRDGDGTTNAADALSRELTRTRRDMRKLASEIENILLEESAEGEPNQDRWPTASRDDVLAGRAVARATLPQLMDAISGRGSPLSIERLAKSAAVIGERIEAASDELSMVEQIAAGSLLSMLDAAAEDQRIAGEFQERLACAGPAVQRVFGV